MTEPLTPGALLEICNEIRREGGAEELSALKPGVRHKASSCLVAANLNFGCTIVPYPPEQPYPGRLETFDARLQQILKDRGWRQDPRDESRWELPADLNASAWAFDRGGYYASKFYITETETT